MLRKIEVQGVRTNSKPSGLTKPSTHTGRSTLRRAEGVLRVLPAQGKVLPEGLAGLRRQDTPRKPARPPSGGFVLSLKLLRCQKEKPLGGR